MIRALALAAACALFAGCGGHYVISFDGHAPVPEPLEQAARDGDLATVERLLAAGADPNQPGLYATPLNAAALRNDNVAVIRALIGAGADSNGRGQEGAMCWASPIFHAASSGDLKNTSALLAAGASVSDLPPCSNLHAFWLTPSIIELLRPHGLDIFATDALGRNELHVGLAPPSVPPPDSIEYLIGAGVPLNARDKLGKTPLSYWREPRQYEQQWFRAWLVERLSNDAEFEHERQRRTGISALLERSGAHL